MNEPSMNPIQQTSETVSSLRLHKDKPQKTAQDWVRDMRMSAAVNKATTGVETDQVTPDLLLATSKRLLGISKREQEPDPKDSLAFQRFYGPEMLFSEHILRDNGKLGRNILWKATNKGNLDFMPVNALEKHISSVFYDSKLAQMMDGSSPLETIDSAYKTTRLGEGGIGSVESAPDEMRTVQPSYFGYIDPIRCYAEDTELMTEKGWKKVQDITGDDKLACLINGRLEYHKPTALSVYDYDGIMYGYDDGHIAYLVTPNHRMYTRCPDPKRNGEPCGYNIRTAEDIHETNRTVNTGMHLPILRNEDETVFHLPKVTADLKHDQVYGMPPQGASLKNIDEIDIVDFAEYMGWYLSEGSFVIDHKRGYYRADISQDPVINLENYCRIKDLIERLPFNATCRAPEDRHKMLSIGRKQLVVYLSQFGKCEDKFIPEWIFNAPLKARLAFREAILRGDGRAQRHLCTKSKRLAEDFARLQFELGESVFIYNEPEKRYENHPGIWVVYWHKRKENRLQKKIYRTKTVPYFTQNYAHKVYCPTVPGGIVYCRRSASYSGFWCGQSPESFRVGLDVYMTKNVMKGTDGKLYQKFIDAKTGKEVLLDSETAANSVVAAPEMMDAKTKSIFALGGPTGIRIVPRDSVQYYLPRADEAYSTSSNLVTMLSGVKNMRVQMGCLHPDTLVLSIDKKGLISTTKAQKLSTGSLPGATEEGISKVFPIRTTVAKFLPKKNWFHKIILKSGRSLITSADHRWPVLRDGEYTLLPANKLKPGDIALRTIFKDVPSRRTFVNHMLVNRELARVFGYIARSLDEPDNKKMRIQLPEDQYPTFLKAMERIGYTEGFNTYTMDYSFCVGIRDEGLKQLLRDMFGATDKVRHIPTEILSAGAVIVGAFLDGYTADPTKVGRDSNDDFWILDIPNLQTRDELAFLFSRIETDTLYRDKVSGKAMDLALKLVPIGETYGDMIMDEIKLIQDKINAPIMIDIDVNDNLYATANGVVTHNSKYPLQAVSIESREAPLVRGLDEASGKDMPTLIGKYLGARFATQDGVVTAVRRDRIDVLYNDGTKGQVGLYVNFPMNAKGYINNTPVVKAGQAFKKGDVLASSNYTDDKGVAAIGTNLRTGWLSWKGGTYEDAVVISESAAKKLTSTTMYKTAVDLDKTISLGKQNYITWKPGEFSKEQMANLDANGIVKPGTVLHKEDPMILAVRTSEPSPGTMGKRILTDLSERWEHDNPGVVTDVVKTRNGVKVYATVTAPAEIGDKLSGAYGNKGVISQIIPDDEMPHNAKGEPLEMLFSPLGLITRCYDEETEFLTRDGWKFGRDVQDTDELYCYDTQSDTWDWGKQLEPFYSKHYTGTMYEYHGRVTDFSVTHGHKIWAATIGCDYQQRQIQDVFGKNIHVPCVAKRFGWAKEHPFILPMVDGCRINVPDSYDAGDWAEFLGWFLAEGSAVYDTNAGRYEVTITQYAAVNPVKVQMIHNLLNRLDIPYTYTKNERQFRIYNKRLAAYFRQFGYSHEKFIPGWLFEQPDYVINRFLDAMLLGDGSITPDRPRNDGKPTYRCRIRLTSEKLIDQLQMLFCMIGIPTVKTCTGNDPRYPESKDQYYLGISMADTTERRLDKGWQKREYDGMVYCPTVATGYILTRRHGKVIILSNTNPAQLYEAQLGKIARKTGKSFTVPAFMQGSMQEYVADQLKQHHITPDEDLINPETGLPIKDVLTGVSYIYKLKHLAESKMSARGTSSYDAEQQPAGKGMDGCFPATQLIHTREGKRSIAAIARGVGIERVTSLSDTKERRFSRVIDRFVRAVPTEDLLTIMPCWGYDGKGKICKAKAMHPTKNHAIYMYDMTQKHAVDIKPGDKLAGLGMRPSDHQMQVIWNLMHQTAIVDHDELWVPYDPEADKLAHFKAYTLKSLGAKVKDGHVVLPHYRLYQAALVDTDYGDLAIALNGLDKAAKAGYELSSCVKQLIAVWIPARVIPDYAYAAQELATEQQRIAEPIELNIEPDMGLMPLIVARINPYRSNKSSVRVYDLTVEDTHRYVLDGGFVVSNSKRFGTLEQSALAGHCLMGLVRVMTKEYGYMPIGQIVKERLPVSVLSYNTNNDDFEWKPVINWFARSVAQEDLWRLVTNARQEINDKADSAIRGYHHALRCTRDHKILTPDRGYVPACELKVGDLVYDRGPIMLDWQKQIVLGTIMGDGYCSQHKNRAGVSVPHLRVAHGPAQHAYTFWMYNMLKNLCKSEPSIVERTVTSPSGYIGTGVQARLATVNSYELTEICDRFYKDVDGKRVKTVPVGIIEELGYAGIAIWYMDDGSIERSGSKPATAMTFHTCGFTIAECERLISELNAFTGLEFSLLMKSGKYPIIRLKHGPRCKDGEVSQTEKFCQALAPYIIEEFRYKLGDNYPKDAPVGTYWQDKIAPPADRLHGEPCVVIESEPDTEPPRDGYVAYDVEVADNHNFIATGIVVSNSSFDIIKDAKWVRGQSNSDFWRSLRTGDIPTMPGEPLVHKKFFAHLTGAGINVRKTPQGVSIFALTNNDVNELAGPRELRSRDTYEARNFRPIDGGLFGQDIFGINGDKWAYIQLDEPVPNPVMEEPLARLLNIPEKKFADVASGKEEVNGIKGSAAMKEALSKLNLDVESERAHQNFKTASPSNKDKALKRYVAIERMRRAGVNPADYMLDKIPVLPPVFRPISSHNGLTMVADSNYLYAQLLDARDDVREAKNLPKEFQQTARENIYSKWKELTGLYAPNDVKLQSKHVQGLLKWALGDSPKFSGYQRKVLSATVDTVGRGAITPDSRLKLNEVGLPEEMAFNIMAPMLERSLVKRGYTPIQAMEMVKEHNPQARDLLVEVMRDHPVLMNRAPTLHKLSVMAFNPKLVSGHAIRVNPSIVVPFGADFDGDTVNIHAPVSDKARQEAYAKMFPERNLIAMRSRSIVYKPEKEYQQGLFIGTRVKQGADVRTHYFNTLEEAKEAYRQGLIDIDDPIEIKSK